MRYELAVKKLKTLGAPIAESDCHIITVTCGGYELSCIHSIHSGDVDTFRVRGLNDHDDWQSDYCAGSFYPNCTQAIKAMIYLRDQENKRTHEAVETLYPEVPGDAFAVADGNATVSIGQESCVVPRLGANTVVSRY
jgi:hypothetical protein